MRALIKLENLKVEGITSVVRVSESEIRSIESINLKPEDKVDIVTVDGKLVLAISDKPISVSVFGEGARFTMANELGMTKAESWILPMVAPSLLARSVQTEDEQAAWALQRCGEYLESHARFGDIGPWQRGRLLAAVAANWDEMKARRLAEGESYWGWVKQHCWSPNNEEGWERFKGRCYEWRRAAEIMLLNTENCPWIVELTLDKIVALKISKVTRAAGAIADGLFDYSKKLQAALFNASVTNADLNHLIALARGHEDKLPRQLVDEETGETQLVDPSTGEIVENLELFLDEYLPDIESDMSVDADINPERVTWTYDYERQAFGYWQYGKWFPILAVIPTKVVDTEVGQKTVITDGEASKFVDRIIALLRVRADYQE